VIGNNGTEDLPFVLKNECGVPDKSVATVKYVTGIFVIVCVSLLMGLYLKRQAVIFDEDEQTAQDLPWMDNPMRSPNRHFSISSQWIH
jgi:hypothetical protein